MRFSIVTPTLNPPELLKGCIASISAQTHNRGDIEHIIQDGGTPDKILQPLVKNSKALVLSENDCGMYDALNKGFSRSTGEILGWLNADEQYLPETLQSVGTTFREFPDTDLIFGNYLIVTPSGHAIAARREIPARRWYLTHGVNYILSCTAFFSRRAWEHWGPLDTDLTLLADKDLYLKMIRDGARVRHINSYLGIYTATGKNLSLSDAAPEEQADVRSRYGAYPSKWLRTVPRACRCLEKLLNGCYRKDTVRYPFFDQNGDKQMHSVYASYKWRN